MAKRATAAAVIPMEPGKAGRVQAERKRLETLFQGAEENKRDFIRREIEKLSWLNVSIADLQQEIDEQGAVIEYQNGREQHGRQQNPACKLLIEYEKLSNTIVRALLPVLPEKDSGPDKLSEFLAGERLPIDLDNI